MRFIADKKALHVPPGFGVPYGTNLAQILVRTTSGKFSDEIAF